MGTIMTDQPHEHTSGAIVSNFLAAMMTSNGEPVKVHTYITEILPARLENMRIVAERLGSGLQVHGLPSKEEIDDYMENYRRLAQAIENLHNNRAVDADRDIFEDAAGIFKGFRNLIERLTDPLVKVPLSESDKMSLQAESESACTEFDNFFQLFAQRFHLNRRPQIFEGIDRLERDSLQGRMTSFLFSHVPSVGYPSSHYPVQTVMEKIIPEILGECTRIADSCLDALEHGDNKNPPPPYSVEEIASYKENLRGFEHTFTTFASHMKTAANGGEITPRMQAEITGFRGDVDGLKRMFKHANYLAHAFQLTPPCENGIDVPDALISLGNHFTQHFDISASWKWPIGGKELARTEEGKVNAGLATIIDFPSNQKKHTFRALLQEMVPQHFDAMDGCLEKLREHPEIVDALPTAPEIKRCRRGMERFTEALWSIRTHTTQPTDLTLLRESHAFLEDYHRIVKCFEQTLKSRGLEPLAGPCSLDVGAFVGAISEHFDLEKAASSPPPQQKIQGGDTEPEGTLERERIPLRNLCYRFCNTTLNTDDPDNLDTEFSVSAFLQTTLPIALFQLHQYADSSEPLRMDKAELQYLATTLLSYVNAMHSIGDNACEFLHLAGMISQLPETLHHIGKLLDKAPQHIDIDVPVVKKQLRSVMTCFEDTFARYQDYTAANTFSRA